jgi:hypothetical protein
MNITRGLFRLWLIASGIYVLAMATIGYSVSLRSLRKLDGLEQRRHSDASN